MKKEMTSRERVLAAFAFQPSDRVPLWCGMSAEFKNKAMRIILGMEALTLDLIKSLRNVEVVEE